MPITAKYKFQEQNIFGGTVGIPEDCFTLYTHVL